MNARVIKQFGVRVALGASGGLLFVRDNLGQVAIVKDNGMVVQAHFVQEVDMIADDGALLHFPRAKATWRRWRHVGALVGKEIGVSSGERGGNQVSRDVERVVVHGAHGVEVVHVIRPGVRHLNDVIGADIDDHKDETKKSSVPYHEIIYMIRLKVIYIHKSNTSNY